MGLRVLANERRGNCRGSCGQRVNGSKRAQASRGGKRKGGSRRSEAPRVDSITNLGFGRRGARSQDKPEAEIALLGEFFQSARTPGCSHD